MKDTGEKRVDSLRYLFLMNPVAGVGGRRDYLQLITGACKKKQVKCKILFTRSPGDAGKIIRKRLEKFDVFVAVGGDGTMNEVATALAGTEGIMGLIPAGSGNALGRELGISMKPENALEQLLNGQITHIDTGLANGKRFVNVCGLGFDNHIARCFTKVTNRGPVPYVTSVFREFFSYKPATYTLRTDAGESTHKAFVLTVANTSQYGNNAYIAPRATVFDGVLDICVLRPFGFLGALGLGIRLFAKSIDKSGYCTYLKTKQVEIDGDQLDFHVDGEPIRNKKPIRVTIEPNSLKVVVPLKK